MRHFVDMAPPIRASIDVDDLMSRIRQEAHRRRERIEQSSSNGNGHVLSAPANVSAVPALPTLHVSTTADPGERLRSLTQEALQKTEVDRRVPKLFRRLFRKQGGFNKLVLEIVRILLRSDSRLSRGNAEIVAYLSAQNHWLQAWIRANATKTYQTETLLQALGDQCSDLREVAKDLETDIQVIGDDLLGYSEQLRETRRLQSAKSIAQVEEFQKATGQAVEALDENLSGLKRQFDALQASHAGMNIEIETLRFGRKEIEDELASREAQAATFKHELSVFRENLGGLKEWVGTQEAAYNGRTKEFANFKQSLLDRENQIKAIEGELTTLRESKGGMQEWLTNHETQIHGMVEKLSAAEREHATLREHLSGLQGWLADRETLAHTIHHDLTTVKETLTGRQTHADSLTAELTALRENVGGMKEWLLSVGDKAEEARARADAVQKQADRYAALEAAVNAELAELRVAIDAARNQAAALDQRQVTDCAFLKAQVSFHSGALQSLTAASLKEDGKGMREAFDAARNIEDHLHDAFYLAFENKFRGSRADIQQRVRVYLPAIKAVGAGQLHAPALDLGCGRGEWLELLREEELIGRGVDLNQFMVAECIERGLAAEQADMLEFLGTLPSGSQGAITAFHLIEHLPFSALLRLFSESLRVLRPGGVCIFETPNPDNIQVGSNRFYTDPTHLRPLPSEYSKFVMSNAGFSQVTILPLHPVADSPPLATDPSPAENFVNRAFFGDQDYAVIGYK
jgi:SAM-dependent methyltransferase